MGELAGAPGVHNVHMADPMTGPDHPVPVVFGRAARPGAERCPACGAALTSTAGTPDADIRGVTTLDPEAILARPGRGLPSEGPAAVLHHRRAAA